MWNVPAVARRVIAAATVVIALAPASARASDQIYFPATDNVITQIINRINAETVRIDISAWYLTEHSISIAIANRFAAGVPVRLLGDRASIFEIDPHTKTEFYWLAAQGVPIRLRYNPSWFPEIDHWKAGIFVGQRTVEFGSANWTTYELAPDPSNPTGNFHDETTLFSDDPLVFGAMETRFDQMWVDTATEPESVYGSAPYLKDWYSACSLEPNCADFKTLYPNPAPMNIDHSSKVTSPTAPPPDLIFGQGPDFNNRLVAEINNETRRIDFVIYRLTVDNVTNALLAKFASGVPVRLIIEPNEYTNRKWPEFWQTHANLDKLWAAGIPILQRAHEGLTHMKMLVTSNYATNASSNYASHWQRDHDYFVSAAAKPAIYGAMANRFAQMWGDSTDFVPFAPGAPASAAVIQPSSGGTGVSTTPTLTWAAAPFATSYDVYLGLGQGSLAFVGNVPAQISDNPPSSYSYTVTNRLNGGTTYRWQVVSRTFATPKDPSMIASSPVWTFTTAGSPTSSSSSSGPLPTNAASFESDSGGDAWLYNQATGAWSEALNSNPGFSINRSGSWSAGWSISGADFNGDGITDLLFYNRTNGGALSAINQTNGAFTFVPQAWAPGWDITTLDLNGDGRSDVFMYNRATGQWFTGISLGNGSFSYTPGQWSAGWQAYAANWNGDGRADLFLYNRSFGSWCRATTQPDTTFTYQCGQWSAWWDVYPGDFNGDGRTDFLLYSVSTGRWVLALATDTGFTYESGQWSANWQITVGDFNGDGRADLFVYNVGSGVWCEVLRNAGGGFSYYGGQWSAGWTITQTDANHDGRTDLLLYNPATGAWVQAMPSSTPGVMSYRSGTWAAGLTIVATRPN